MKTKNLFWMFMTSWSLVGVGIMMLFDRAITIQNYTTVSIIGLMTMFLLMANLCIYLMELLKHERQT